MLSQPTSKRFLEAVQQTLRTSVLPAVSTREATVNLQAIDAILAGLIRRVGVEADWMRGEIADIEQAAEAVIAQGADKDGAIARSLANVRAERKTGEDGDNLEADYGRASELLSLCLERALVAGGSLRTQLDAVLETRLTHENFIRGTFKVVGKD